MIASESGRELACEWQKGSHHGTQNSSQVAFQRLRLEYLHLSSFSQRKVSFTDLCMTSIQQLLTFGDVITFSGTFHTRGYVQKHHPVFQQALATN